MLVLHEILPSVEKSSISSVFQGIRYSRERRVHQVERSLFHSHRMQLGEGLAMSKVGMCGTRTINAVLLSVDTDRMVDCV